MKDEFREFYQQFGLNVVYYRKKKRLSQTQLAELADIHRTYVSAIELGKVSVSFDVLFRLAQVLEVSRVKDEVAFVVLNGNYALQAGFSVAHDAVAYETSASAAAKTYANVLVVKAGNENNEGIQALVKVLKSDEIKQFINDTYDGAVIPFED